MNTEKFNQLVERYKKSPKIRGLVQLIPWGIGSGVDVYLTQRLENIKEERTKTFFDELKRGEIYLTNEIVESEDFLHIFFITVKAAMNTRRREKIRYFARLLISSFESTKISTVDEYEEILSILDEVSLREFGILVTLSKFEEKYQVEKKARENDLQRAMRFWTDFSSEVCSKFSISKDELGSILTRLNRTGLYETFIGNYMGYTGGKGKTTALYKKLEKAIQIDENEFRL